VGIVIDQVDFDSVRVTEITEVCGVSEKTVFNYFPTKESLVLDLGVAVEAVLRIRSTPSLRAYQRDTNERLITVAAEILARRMGLDPSDPEPQIAATALLGLWPIQFRELGKHLDGTRTTEQLRQAVTARVDRAARLIDTGLGSFAVSISGTRPSHVSQLGDAVGSRP